jgi:thiol-disulfide isomerase/thioredoxin
MDDIWVRLALLLLLAALVAAGVLAIRWRARRRLDALQADSVPLWSALGLAPDGRPTVIAFSTASCVVCKTVQAPALAELRRETRHVRVVAIDAEQRPEVADAFRVATVPTTVVLSRGGDVAVVNNGPALAGRLLEQLRAVG